MRVNGGIISTITDMGRLAAGSLAGVAPGQAAIAPLDRVEPVRPLRSVGMFWVIDRVPGSDRTMAMVRWLVRTSPR